MWRRLELRCAMVCRVMTGNDGWVVAFYPALLSYPDLIRASMPTPCSGASAFAILAACRFLSPILAVVLVQPPHAVEPAVVVAGLALHIFQDLRVRQAEETFGGQGFDHGIDQFLWFYHAIDAGHAAAV